MNTNFNKFLNILIIIIITLGFFSYGYALEHKNKTQKLKLLKDKVQETFVIGEITKDTPYFNNYGRAKKTMGNFKKGEVVEIIRDRSYEWYLVKSKDGKEGWIYKSHISIPKDPETNMERMTKDEIETFVNLKGLNSDTGYLVWVDIDRQLVYVFLGKEGNWRLHKTMLASTGENISPTLKGVHKIQDRGTWFYTNRLKSGAKYWVRYNGPFLFHSLPMDKQGNIIDYTLGKRSSSGCIRLPIEDSKWFYKYVSENSTVFVN